MPDDISIRQTSVELIRPLRHAVLRAGLPPEAAVFDGDDEATARHVGAFNQSGDLVGCVTIVQRPWNDERNVEPAWQLRGMAVRPDVAGRGIGRRLVIGIERFVTESVHSSLLWCNARTPAVGFYRTMGWTIVGDEFHIETAGPHYRMFKRL